MPFPDYTEGLTVLAGALAGAVIDYVMELVTKVYPPLAGAIVGTLHIDDAIAMAICLLIGVTAGPNKTQMLFGFGALGALIAVEISDAIHVGQVIIRFMPRLTQMKVAGAERYARHYGVYR